MPWPQNIKNKMNDYQAHSDKAKPTPLASRVQKQFVLRGMNWLILDFFFLLLFYRLFAKLARKKTCANFSPPSTCFNPAWKRSR
jgi:hypothetical protein